MAIVDVPQIQLPKGKYEQLKNGTKGIIFKISPEYVGKVLFEKDGENEENYWLKRDKEAISELRYEENINRILYEKGIGNVPKPIGIKILGLYGLGGDYPVYIMEYIKGLPHGDEIVSPHEQYIARNLVKEERDKAADIDLFPGKDYLHPWNYFYDAKNKSVRLIDFGRWTVGDDLLSPYQ